MPRSYASLTTATAEDADWCALPVELQWAYTLLLRLPKLSLAGCVDVKLRPWAKLASDIDETRLEDLFERLEQLRYIRWDRDTEELAIRTFVRNDRVLQNRNSGRGMWSAWASMESEELRLFVAANMPAEAFDEQYRPRLAERPIEPPLIRPFEGRSDPAFRTTDRTTDRTTTTTTGPLPNPSTTTVNPPTPPLRTVEPVESEQP